MPQITLHDLDGAPLGTLDLPPFEHPPRAVFYDGEVYVDFTRSHARTTIRSLSTNTGRATQKY